LKNDELAKSPKQISARNNNKYSKIMLAFLTPN